MGENTTSTTKTRRTRAAMPYIMPDGRPLAVFLAETEARPTSHRGRARKKGRRGKEPSQGWTSGSLSTSMFLSTAQPSPQQALSEAEIMELNALEKVGQRRQRRWLNDRLLRAMAPPMTAKDMEALFKPAPFGETGHESPWTTVARQEHAPVWDLFRSVDADRESRVLQKWEAHVEELRRESENTASTSDGSAAQTGLPERALHSAANALSGWSKVGHDGRRALRRAPYSRVQELEAHLLGVLESQEASPELAMELDDGFDRLLVHSLAAFYGLITHSKDVKQTPGRQTIRQVLVRRPRLRHDSSACQQPGTCVPLFTPSRVLCSDVIWLLEDSGGANLTTRSLCRMLTCSGGASPRAARPKVVAL